MCRGRLVREGATRLAYDPCSGPAVMDESLEESRLQLGGPRAPYGFEPAILWREPVYPMRSCSREQAVPNRLPLPTTEEVCYERSTGDNSSWPVQRRRAPPMGKSRPCRPISVQRVCSNGTSLRLNLTSIIDVPHVMCVTASCDLHRPENRRSL